MNLWHSIMFKHIIMGYSEAYKPTERKQVLEELYAMMNSPHGLIKARYDLKAWEERKQKFINPIFKNLIAAVERHLAKG